MTVLGTEAWITSAMEDKNVNRAIVLAGSLRRVRTQPKLVVMTTFGVSSDLRDKLKEAFDLVFLIEYDQKEGLTLEESAMAEAFTLHLFSKCVYLSPNALVLNNCDDIFEKYARFAALHDENEKVGIDLSVFLFTPSMGYSRVLEKIKCHGNRNGYGNFAMWMQNLFSNSEKLDKQYNNIFKLKSERSQSLSSSASIVNFTDEHPLDMAPKINDGSTKRKRNLGTIEKYAAELCNQLNMQNINPTPNIHSDLSIQLSTVFKKEPIAIVGMSFRLPGGNNVNEFWDMLMNGRHGITPLPPSRWPRSQTVKPCQNRNVEAGFLSVPVNEFDANFFGMDEKQAELLDPQARILHEVAWEALEDALIDPHSLRGTKTGVFAGSWLQDYYAMTSTLPGVDVTELHKRSSLAAGATTLSHFLKTTGPSIGTESGCSSAIVAVDMACKSLQNHDSNMALACGVNLLLFPFDYNTMSVVLSPEGRCKTFDEGANGFARAEGCAVLLLKRLSDAMREGDNIWGLIRGSGVTQEGISKSLGTPTVYCETLAMELALMDAQVNPLDVSYIEAHGTGTPVGDPMEISAITKAYSKGRSKPLVIGSVKTNVGHTESVSGITGIIKVLLAMKNEVIPKHLNLKRLNPAINLEAIPAELPLEPIEWPKRSDKPRIAGVSSFGISGTDGHVIVQEPPAVPPREPCEDILRPMHVMKISAQSPESFKRLLSTYGDILSSREDQNGFADLAYSANIGRATFNHRAVIIAKDFREAKLALSSNSFKWAEVKSSNGKLCFVFPGEDSQYTNVGASLYATSPVFRDSFDTCQQLLERKYRINLREVLWGQDTTCNELNKQTSIFCIEYCLLKLWESWGVKPDYVMGYRVGEFTAAISAGFLDFKDALKLVAEKGLLINSLPQGKEKVLTPSLLETYRNIATTVRTPQVQKNFPKYISGMDGKLLSLEAFNADYWVRHAQEPVQFKDACNIAQTEGCSLFLRIGPQSNMTASEMMSMSSQPITCLSSIKKNENEWATLLDSLSALYLSDWKGQIDWAGFDRHYKRSRVTLPFYPFNRKPIWKELESELPTIHPLLGKVIPTASNTTKIFENRLTLKNAPFIQDHVIGNTVVFPGAGFLEMCLAGGFAADHVTPAAKHLQKPQRPLVLNSLRIASPLGLYESGMCRLQTTAIPDNDDIGEENGIRYNVAVHRYVPSAHGGIGEWISHATAKLHTLSSALTEEQSSPIDIQTIQNSWGKTNNTDFYEKLPEVGLRFGPKFRSLETGWKSEKGMLVTVKVPEEDGDNYLIHPVVADAMIQATMLWTNKDKIKVKLQVPVQIGEFTWLQTSTSTIRYIYCATNESGKTDCILVDDNGTRLALMADVDLIETTVKLVEGMIQQQGAAMPKLWKEIWKSIPGPLQCSYDSAADIKIPMLNHDENNKLPAELNDVDEQEINFYDNICNLTKLYFLNAMYELGWKPKQSEPFAMEELVQLLPQPKEHFKRYIRYFLKLLADTGLLNAVPGVEDNYYFSGQPPTQQDIDNGLAHVTGPNDTSRVEYRLLVKCGQNLSKVWLGQLEPLQLLFPENPSEANASQFYAAALPIVKPIFFSTNFPSLASNISARFDDFMKKSKAGSDPPVYRVLEVGSGTGAMSKDCLDFFEDQKKPYEYHFTDISASFFIGAEKELEKYSKHIIFKKLNMDEDALSQGFAPKYFDLIIACEVLHAAKNIRKTLRNLRRLLKPGGGFLVIETTVPDPRITQIFGLLEGYWQFEDLDIRPYHTTLTPEKWEQVFKEVDCDNVTCTLAYNGVHGSIAARRSTDEHDVSSVVPLEKTQYSWLIFYNDSNSTVAELLKEKLVGVNRKVHAVKRPDICTEDAMKELMKTEFHIASEEVERIEGVIYLWGLEDGVSNRDQAQVSLPVINLMHLIMECKVLPRLFIVTQGTSPIDGSEVTNPTAGTLHGIVKSLSNEIAGLPLCCLDLAPNESSLAQADNIFHDLWGMDSFQRSVIFRDNKRMVPRMCSTKVLNNEPLPLPSGCDRFQLILPKTKLISDLEFGVLENFTLKGREVEVQAKAMALNFRDVFTVIKPIPEFDELNAVGLDLAGVVTKVGPEVTQVKIGDRVLGMNQDKNMALPSHHKLHELGLIKLPEKFTYIEGVTLPAVFITAFHCLISVAEMKRGDKVLIHTASGGVGLCAVQLAQRVGAEIFATAGSKRKQTYLRNLGIKHIFHSRTTHFGREILEATHGEGVDIILNSITGEGFKEASLSALRKNGNFIEMSKLNVWKPEEVKLLRPDVFYEIVDLPSLEPTKLEELTRNLERFLRSGDVNPIAYERFDAVNIRGALNHLQKAKHIGKIVCVMPEIKVENSKFTATTPLFNDMSTYLVTGGLGGIGFEVVKWMLSSGAKHIAIASRSNPKPEIASQIEAWNKNGKNVEAFAVDIGDFNQCQNLFNQLKSPSRSFPPLRGVMHAAGVLSDSIMENQTWDKFRYTYNPKVYGTWNLHDLTKDLLLEHFVVFSSMAASMGSPGQTNHSASNSFEDALAAYRITNGLPATSVNWGNWGEVGVATELDFPGMRPIPTSQGILALETFLRTQVSHMAVINIDSMAMAGKVFPHLKTYVDDIRLFGELKATVIINSDDFWKEVDSAEDREGKVSVFKLNIKSILRNILKMDQDEVIDDLAEFQTLGIDSLMMLEMKNGLQNIFGSRLVLTASQLKDCNNTEVLSNRLVDILEGEENLAQITLPTMEELKELVREDSILPENIRPTEGMQIKDASQIQTILLVGATGTLGPYLLRELSQRPTIKKVYCLVRKCGKETHLERLLKRLQTVGIEDQVDVSKVECIQGDLTDDKFGLSDEEYSRLAKEVDSIVNSAVRADHTAKYYKSPERKKLDIRNVNVKGTIRLLEFAVHTTLKHFYHASTLLTVTTTNEEHGNLSEDWEDVGAFDNFTGNAGYPLSKHISEQLCKQATERGIPVKTFRLPGIGGDSKTGRCDYLTNHFILRWLAFMKLRCMPDIPTPMQVMAVDHCAEISLELFFHPMATWDVYNVMQKDAGMDQTLITIADEIGIHIEPVSFSEFVAKLKLESDDSPLGPFKKMYEDEEAVVKENLEGNLGQKALQGFVEDSSKFYKSYKLPQMVQNYESWEPTEVVMRRDIKFLRDSGVFEKFDIKY